MHCRHTFRALCVPLLCAIAISAIYAGIDIDHPTGDPKYAPTSSIATKGNTFLGVDVLVKIVKNDVTHDEEIVVPGKQSIEWSKGWAPPSGGWPLGTDYEVRVWDADDPDGLPEDTEEFRVTTM